jgi:hydrogenase maturation protein HypF
LFDGVAVLCGLSPPRVSFEGQAAMALEFVADWNVDSAYPVQLCGHDPMVVDWEPMIREILADRSRGLPVARISAQFHNALAEMAVAVAQRARCSQIVLSGGCFQNVMLTQRTRRRLLDSGMTVYTQSQVPPGDGGIALGQILIAARQMEESIHVSRNPG